MFSFSDLSIRLHRCKASVFLTGFIVCWLTYTASSQPHHTSPTTSQKEADYRQVNWGMDQQQVRAAEAGNQPLDWGDQLEYFVAVQGKPCSLIYRFDGNKLVSARVYLPVDEDADLLIYAFKELNKTLIRKYGKPNGNKVTHRGQSYGVDYDLSSGRTTYLTHWTFKNTSLVHVLYSTSHLKHILIYRSKQFINKLRIKKQSISDL